MNGPALFPPVGPPGATGATGTVAPATTIAGFVQPAVNAQTGAIVVGDATVFAQLSNAYFHTVGGYYQLVSVNLGASTVVLTNLGGGANAPPGNACGGAFIFFAGPQGATGAEGAAGAAGETGPAGPAGADGSGGGGALWASQPADASAGDEWVLEFPTFPLNAVEYQLFVVVSAGVTADPDDYATFTIDLVKPNGDLDTSTFPTVTLTTASDDLATVAYVSGAIDPDTHEITGLEFYSSFPKRLRVTCTKHGAGVPLPAMTWTLYPANS